MKQNNYRIQYTDSGEEIMISHVVAQDFVRAEEKFWENKLLNEKLDPEYIKTLMIKSIDLSEK